MLSLVLILLTLSKAEFPQQKFKLIIEHFHTNKIPLSYIFSCWSKTEDADLKKLLSEINTKSSFPKTEDEIATALRDRDDVTLYGYVLDFTCENLQDTLRKNQRIYRQNRPWLILSDRILDGNFWSNIKLRLDSSVLIATLSNQFFDLYDAYNPGFDLGGSPVVHRIGIYNSSGLHLNRTSVYAQRKKLDVINIRSGSVVVNNDARSFEEYIQDQKNKETDTMSKFHYPLFLFLRDIHHFTFNVTLRTAWFGNYANGTDDGIGRLLYENKVDVTCTGASTRPRRFDVYEYLNPTYRFRPAYFFRNPGVYKLITDTFLTPFTKSVWYFVFIFTVLVTISLKVMHDVEKRIFRLRAKYSWYSAFITTISVIFQQDFELFSTHPGSRIAYLFLLIMSTLLYNYYTSSILSSLLSRPPLAIRNLDELGRSHLEIGIENCPYTLTWYKLYNDSDIQYIVKNKVFPPKAETYNYYEVRMGVARVAEKGFAYHTQADTIYPIAARTFDQDAICDLNHIWMIPETTAGIMTQKKSEYKEMFIISLRQVQEAGFIHRTKGIWESPKPKCSSTSVVAAGRYQTFTAFLCLLVGILIAFLLFIVELIWFRFETGNTSFQFQRKNRGSL